MRKLIISKHMVCESGGGFYVGQWCLSFCLEPWDRETGYYGTFEEADTALRIMYEPDEITTKDEFFSILKPFFDEDREASKAGRTDEREIRCGQCNTVYLMHLKQDEYDKFKQKEIRLSQFTYLDADEREMLQSQICPECWNQLFPEEE